MDRMDLDKFMPGWRYLPVQVVRHPDQVRHPGWSKLPLIHDWPTEASADRDRLFQWFGPSSPWAKLGEQFGVGAVMGTPIHQDGAEPLFLHAVDVDPRNGGTSEGLPETLTASTISGGTHHYYLHPGPLRNGVLRAGVDFKGQNGFVVVPPTVGYSWINPGTPIAPLPDWVADQIGTKTPPTMNGAVELPEFEPLPLSTEDPYIWSLFCDFAEEQAVPGTRYRRTFRFMSRLYDLGLSFGQIRTAIWQYPPAMHKENEFPGWLDADLLRFMEGRP